MTVDGSCIWQFTSATYVYNGYVTDISFELSRLVVPSHVAWAMARMRGRLGKLRLKWIKMDEHVNKTKKQHIVF